MGGKSKKKATVGYWYKLLAHWGLGLGPIDAFLEWRGGTKTAWSGELTATGTISINKPNLWGGEKDQGGIVSDVDVLFGNADQTPNAYLLANLGNQVPAWRGLSTLVFKGGKYGALNPYPQASSFKIRRIKRGWFDGATECWYPETAEISIADTPTYTTYWRKTTGNPYTFTSPSQVSGWDPDPAAHSVEDASSAPTWPVGEGATGIAWLHIDAPDGVATSFYLDVKINYDDSGAVIGTSGVTIGEATAPPVISGYPRSAGVRVIVPAHSGPFSGWVAFACVDVRDIETGAVLGSPSNHRMLCSSIAVITREWAINPAHALYYARTHHLIGREPVESMNDASWRAAADWYYAQGFGLCTSYDPSSESLAEFESRICKVAGCSITRSLTDGQLYIDIANGEYTLEDLPILTDDDVIEFSEQPTVLDAAVNSLQVKYFDPQTKEDVTTAPVQALGLIDAYGTITQVNEYPEIPTAALAMRVADRDLRATATPLRAFNLTCTRTPRDWRPGTYCRLQLPKRGVADMVCIVGSNESGTLKSGAVKLTVTQDVYSLPSTSYVEQEPGVDTRPDQTPQPIVHQAAFEAPYIDLVASLSRADMAALPDDVGYLEAVAADPSSSRNYTLAVQDAGGSWDTGTTGDWCPTATVTEAAGYLDTAFTLSAASGLDDVAIGSAALWDDEIVRVDAIDATAGTVTLARGCADTVPAAHAAGSRLWFWQGAAALSATEYTDGESLTVKLLTNTGSEQLPLASATALPFTFAGRQSRPYPPAHVQVNGEDYPDEAAGSVELTWSHRDRVTQADQLIDTTAGNIGPETGTTYTVEYYTEAGTTPLDSETGITGTTSTAWAPPSDGKYRLELYSVRAGLESWQRWQHVVMIGAELWTPALLAGDPYWSDVVALLNMGGTDGSTTFTDSTGLRTWTASGNAQIDTSLGYNAALFDGSGDRIATTYSTAAFDWWTSGYTVEAWINVTTLSSWYSVPNSADLPCMIGCMAPAGQDNYWSFGPIGGGALRHYYYNGGEVTSAKTTGTMPVGDLAHIAMCHTGGSIYLAINGVVEGPFAVSGTPLSSTAVALVLGQYRNRSIAGWVKALRITKGTARYTSGFTPPESFSPFAASAADVQRLAGYNAWQTDTASSLPSDHPFRHVPPYVNTPELQPSFASDPVVLGFVAATDTGNVGLAAGPAVAAAFGTLLNSEPSLTTGEGIEAIYSGSSVTVTLTGLTPPATPTQAVLLDHKGNTLATIALSGSGPYTGSATATLADGGVYYLRIEAA